MGQVTTSLSFPVLCIYKKTIFTVGNEDSLTSTTSAALRGGLFKDLRIIDSQGKEVIVSSATKLHGIGSFFGFNIFLNQRIRVNLDAKLTGKTLTTEDVRQLILRDFREWGGWESRGDLEQVKEAVENASSVKKILQAIVSPLS